MDPAALAAWRGVLGAHAVVVGESEQRLRTAGLPPLGWYDALEALHEASGHRLRHHELADRVPLSRSGLSRLLDRMADAGAIERRPSANDRRGAEVVLTDEGAELRRRMWPVYSQVIQERFAEPTGIYAAGIRDAMDAVVRRAR